MSNFKIKHDKNKHIIQINTLDEKHKGMMNEFSNKKTTLPIKKKKLLLLKVHLEKIEQMDAQYYTTDDINKRSRLKTEIKDLEDEIDEIENDTSELDYYIKTGDIIMDYYQLAEQDDNMFYDEYPELRERKNVETDVFVKMDQLDMLNKKNMSNKKIVKQSNRRKKNIVPASTISIIDFLSGNNSISAENITENTESDTNNEEYIESANINEQPVKNKANLFSEYMVLVDSDYACEFKKHAYGKIRMCETCNIEKTLINSDGILVCQKCGEVERIIIDSEKPNYKEAITENKTGYPYKRSNHLNEWLSQFQAKESIDIPDGIYDMIIAELRKNRIYDMKKLALQQMKKILKSLRLTQYYGHATYIISKLSGISPPTINRETEDKIRLMFRQIQVSFEKNCPKGRTNFLSYSYVLHKFFQLLELDEFVKYFPLLKSREKLKIQDEIWEKICYDLNWEYYPSI